MEVEPVELSTTVFCGVMAGVICVWITYEIVCARRAQRARRARFAGREPVAPDEWFPRLVPDVAQHADTLTPVLEALGRIIGIDWTCLRPEDGFAGSLRLPHAGAGRNDLENFDTELEVWAERRGIAGMIDAPPDDQLGSLVRILAQALERRERGADDAVLLASRSVRPKDGLVGEDGVGDLLADLEASLSSGHTDARLVAQAVRRILEFLNVEKHDTDENCRLVDEFIGLHLLDDSGVKERLRALPGDLALIIQDMGTCLHDAHKARAVAENFESTPQQLLRRLRAAATE